MLDTKDYLAYIVNEIHTVVTATVDEDGLPVTSAIDMMDYDAYGLYFLTAKGKGFYSRLIKSKRIALTAIKSKGTMSSTAISIRGKVKELGYDKTPEFFEKNPYMNEIYPTEKSMKALTVFKIYEGAGEFFDLSKKPIERNIFAFGGAKIEHRGYLITEECVGCGNCLAVCPQDCIVSSEVPFVIEQKHCLHCGNCKTICPVNAVIRR